MLGGILLHCLLIGFRVLICVIGGIAGMDARHSLHNVIGILLELFHRFAYISTFFF